MGLGEKGPTVLRPYNRYRTIWGSQALSPCRWAMPFVELRGPLMIWTSY